MKDDLSDSVPQVNRRSFLGYLASVCVSPKDSVLATAEFTPAQKLAAVNPLLGVLSKMAEISAATSIDFMHTQDVIGGKESRLNAGLSLGKELSASAGQLIADQPAAQALIDEWMGSFEAEKAELWQQYSGMDRASHYGALCRQHNERREKLLSDIGLSAEEATELSKQLREVDSQLGLSLNLGALANDQALSLAITQYVEQDFGAAQAISGALKTLRSAAQQRTTSTDNPENAPTSGRETSGNDGLGEMTESEFLRSHMDHPDVVCALSRKGSHVDKIAEAHGVTITR